MNLLPKPFTVLTSTMCMTDSISLVNVGPKLMMTL